MTLEKKLSKKQKSIKIENIWRFLPSLFFPGFTCWLWKRNMQKIQEEEKKKNWYVVLNFILNACKVLSTRWCHSKGRALKIFRFPCGNQTEAQLFKWRSPFPVMTSRESFMFCFSVWTVDWRSAWKVQFCPVWIFFFFFLVVAVLDSSRAVNCLSKTNKPQLYIH